MGDFEARIITDAARAMLCSWYVTWDTYKDHRHGVIRRLALRSKCYGLVSHDRFILIAEERLRG